MTLVARCVHAPRQDASHPGRELVLSHSSGMMSLPVRNSLLGMPRSQLEPSRVVALVDVSRSRPDANSVERVGRPLRRRLERAWVETRRTSVTNPEDSQEMHDGWMKPLNRTAGVELSAGKCGAHGTAGVDAFPGSIRARHPLEQGIDRAWFGQAQSARIDRAHGLAVRRCQVSVLSLEGNGLSERAR